MTDSTMTMIRLLIAAVLFCAATVAQFPRRCVDSESLASRECCPTAQDGSKCGVDSGRGSCELVAAAPTDLDLNQTRDLLLDERARWPLALYDRACSCKGNFDGLDCSRCLAGFQGLLCRQRTPIVVRRNLTAMTVDQVQQYVNVINEAKTKVSENYVILTTSYDRILKGEIPEFRNVSVYNLFVWMHSHVSRNNLVFPGGESIMQLLTANDLGLSAKMKVVEQLLMKNISLDLETSVDYGHEGPAFLPWHRYYLLKWEQELRETVAKDPTFTLPYWDWRGSDDCDVCNDVMMGGRDQTNETLISPGSPFSRWSVICTRGDDYIQNGRQCTGEPEGPLLRNPGNYDPIKITGLPTGRDVDNALALGDAYDTPGFDILANYSYRNIIEGFAFTETGEADPVQSHLHNAVHLFMNGTMSSVDSSANDPIFVIHHAFVDSLFELWLRRKQEQGNQALFDTEGARLGHRAQDFMVPFFPLVRNERGFARTRQLGYVYDYIDVITDDLNESDNVIQTVNSDQTDQESSELTADNDSVIDNLAAVDNSQSVDEPTNVMNSDVTQGNDDVSSGEAAVFPANFNENPAPPLWTAKRNNRFAMKRRLKVQRGLRLRPRKVGEGGFSVYDDITSIVVDSGSVQQLLADNRGLAIDVSSTKYEPSLWQRIKNFFTSLNRTLRDMPAVDLFLITLLCILTVLLSCLCNSACSAGRVRPLKTRAKPCRSGLARRCCCGLGSEPSETVALLDKPTDQGNCAKAKLANGNSYM